MIQGMLRVAEFHGSGGALLGARWAGQIPVFAAAMDAPEADTIEANLPGIPVRPGIPGVRPKDVPMFEAAWVGGLSQRDLDGIREIFDSVSPRAVCIQDTPRNKGDYVAGLVDWLIRDLGYCRQTDKYSASEFGPQDATRFFSVLFRGDVRPGEDFPWPDAPGELRGKGVGAVMSRGAPRGLWLTDRQLSGLDDGRTQRRILAAGDMLPAIPRYYHKHYDILLDDGGLRKLSPGEIAAAQGFGIDWKLPVCRTKAYSILGRAMWPPVAKALFGELNSWLY